MTRHTGPVGAPRTSEEWAEAFRANALSMEAIPWERGPELTPAERSAVASSLQAFQLGESSEGHNLIRSARAYAARSGDHGYEPAVRLFIAEEQRHARVLGRFLASEGVATIGATWTDTVFRRLRRGSGLETSIAVLLSAELVAQVYYRAVRDATASTVLRAICDQVLLEEDEHVRFQCERLALLRRGRPPWKRGAAHVLQRLFVAGTTFVVFAAHARALRAGGFDFGAFRRAMSEGTEAGIRLMDPRSYWPATAAPSPGPVRAATDP